MANAEAVAQRVHGALTGQKVTEKRDVDRDHVHAWDKMHDVLETTTSFASSRPIMRRGFRHSRCPAA